MNQDIQRCLATLNAAWQRYTRATGGHPDPTIAEALSRDYRAAWEGLDACGIAEWMLEYDPITLTFSLPSHGQGATDAASAVPFARPTDLAGKEPG